MKMTDWEETKKALKLEQEANSKFIEMAERYDWEGNPMPPEPPADRIEKQPGALFEILIAIAIGAIIGIIILILQS